MAGAGFGNKMAPEPTHDESDESYRFGKHTEGGAYSNAHDKYGSGSSLRFLPHNSFRQLVLLAKSLPGATGGAGFGNKSNPDHDMSTYDNKDLRFASHTSTAPYSGGHPDYGSGSTGGAGFGNKTGNMETNDSTIGKVMEKVGSMVS